MTDSALPTIMTLEPCPFCQNPLYVDSTVNPLARCETDGCWMNARQLSFPVDDPAQVKTWNMRAETRPSAPTAKWPLRARVWTRESTNEKVLEIEGVINDCHLTSRHTQPIDTPDEDVPGLPTLYEHSPSSNPGAPSDVRKAKDTVTGDYTETEIQFIHSLLDRYSEDGGIIDLGNDHQAFMRIVRKHYDGLPAKNDALGH